MVNIKKIQDKIDELKISKAQLIKVSGLTRVTIDKILKGGEVNVSTLEALANGLGVSVGFFFDDCFGDNGQVLSGGSHNRLASHNIGMNMEEHDELIRLREENRYLKQMLADKEREIADNKRIINHFIGKA